MLWVLLACQENYEIIIFKCCNKWEFETESIGKTNHKAVMEDRTRALDDFQHTNLHTNIHKAINPLQFCSPVSAGPE